MTKGIFSIERLVGFSAMLTLPLGACGDDAAAIEPFVACEAPRSLDQKAFSLVLKGMINPRTGRTARLFDPIASHPLNADVKIGVIQPPGNLRRRIETLRERRPDIFEWNSSIIVYGAAPSSGLQTDHQYSFDAFSLLRFTDDRYASQGEPQLVAMTYLPFLHERFESPAEQLARLFSVRGRHVEVTEYGDRCAVGVIYEGDLVVGLGRVLDFRLPQTKAELDVEETREFVDSIVNSSDDSFDFNALNNVMGAPPELAAADRDLTVRCEQQMGLYSSGVVFLDEAEFAIARQSVQLDDNDGVGAFDENFVRAVFAVKNLLSIHDSLTSTQLCAAFQSLETDWEQHWLEQSLQIPE